jgi:hypothetical protein
VKKDICNTEYGKMNKNIEKIGRKINDNIFFKYFDNRNFEN